MKKTFILTVALLTFIIVTAHAQKKVAVVTFYINRSINVTDFGATAFVAVTKLRDDPNFNLGPLLQDFHSRFFDSYSKDFPFQLLPEEQVTNNEAYKAYAPVGIVTNGGVMDIGKYTIPADGYKIFLPLAGWDNERTMVKVFNQADGVMDVFIDFKLIPIGFGGMGVVKVEAHAGIILFNKAGEKVFYLDEYAKSKKASPLIGGVPVMTVEKILPMCDSAIDELMLSLQKDMRKMTRKADAKL